MKAMVLHGISSLETNPKPLTLVHVPVPQMRLGMILLKVSACGVCHTELDEIEGRTPPRRLPIILGHQVVGRVEAVGEEVTSFRKGDRVGVAWIFSSCGRCAYCSSGNENLCPEFKATGRDANGGYAEYMSAHGEYVYPIPEVFTDAEAAPLLCAGAIGFRSLRLARLGDAHRLGLTGFGASAHLVLKMVRHQFPAVNVFVFARNEQERELAKELGAVWTGGTEASAPEKLDAIIDTTPTWKPVVEALKNLAPGGRLVINAIRKEEGDKEYLARLNYPAHLWMEKEIKSVANVTRQDVSGFLQLAASVPIRPIVEEYALEDANTALNELKGKRILGAKVLRIS